MTSDLFEPEDQSERKGSGLSAPLAERVRPNSFEDFLGQKNIVGEGKALRRLIERGRLPSLIFWGPPGCGKTTLALLIANYTHSDFVTLSAVTAQIRDVRQILEQAKRNRRHNRETILFVDEIHRFNKAQQDAFLPAVESGVITLIGATTENPSFSVIAPLMSRCRVFTLKSLDPEDLRKLLRRALSDEKYGLAASGVEVADDAMDAIVDVSEGDARKALTLLEMGVEATRVQELETLTTDTIKDLAQRHLFYDRAGEEHFNLISAFHKSLRSSDPQAALYWMARMLCSGEDPLYVGRRMVRFATEDIGLADPQALVQALAACQAYQMLGSPEGELALVQSAIYLATAPKSNALYRAEAAVNQEVQQSGSLPVPLSIRNAPTGLMKNLGYGKGYTYDHESPDHFIAKQCLPDKVNNEVYYEPGAFGFEREIQKRLEWWETKRREVGGGDSLTNQASGDSS